MGRRGERLRDSGYAVRCALLCLEIPLWHLAALVHDCQWLFALDCGAGTGKRAVELLGLLARGQDPAAQRDWQKANPTIRTLTNRYLAEHVQVALKASSAHEYRRVIERFIIPQLGNLRTADVTTEHVNRLHRRLRATPRQANIVLQVASKMFELAERWGDRPIRSNPCLHVVRFKEVSRDRFLSEAEIARLGDVMRQCERGWTAAQRLPDGLLLCRQ